MTARVLFLDRDGTLIRDENYLRDPNLVVPIAGVFEGLRRFIDAGCIAVIVTNQSGIARGLIAPLEYAAVEKRVVELLADNGIPVHATYYCPHHPDFDGPCACRKPGTELFERAMRDLSLPSDSQPSTVYLGDRYRDIVAAQRLGGRGILIPSPSTPADELERARAEFEVAATMDDAATLILGQRQHTGPPTSGHTRTRHSEEVD